LTDQAGVGARRELLRVEIGMKRERQIVNVTGLQTDLITWLERVRASEEALVSDLNRPIARLLPVEIGDDIEAEELEMAAAAGLVRLPTEELPESFWQMEAPVVALEDIVDAVKTERDED
jgi:antitoxin (DNA-binding transcriptional repressor) of toxin-antitoxin stability system